MFNCYVPAIVSLASQLTLEQVIRNDDLVGERAASSNLNQEEIERISGWMNIATKVSDEFEMGPAHARIKIISKKLKNKISHREISTEIRVLRETMDEGYKSQLIYRYPDQKKTIFKNWAVDWADTVSKFPSTKKDVYCAVDLWALGHNTASVFHLMRVLEYGLRAMANDVNANFEYENWQNIIEKIESNIKIETKQLPKGSARSERLKFLSEAAKELVYFKDGWRNFVSHNRVEYSEEQAFIALNHVRYFMTTLASKLTEISE
ncbi:hypothetical protein SAMN05216304_104359 [Bosea sp. OK403]|uniref:hypothetical protein n=1 Tax=Bosea sp. OK403 TaxID=1855286 RepID=UPI0008E17900|nr:hypothetical protein [Bosea sp. OK403]SFJ08190.1 hypothetical protein SAMN05216304_104359 [Bosea sp. OK403]